MKLTPIFGILEAALRLWHFVAATLAAPHIAYLQRPSNEFSMFQTTEYLLCHFVVATLQLLLT